MSLLMDIKGSNLNMEKNEHLDSVESAKDAMNGETEENSESKLLLPSKRGGLLKKSGKPRLKVQWNDKYGDKLAEVLEFQPNDTSDSGGDESDSCMCRMM